MSRWAVVLLAIVLPACAPTICGVQAGTLAVTFDEPQLVDNDPLLEFYNGGTTFRGIGGGPDLGVSFGLNARVRTQDVLVGVYTGPGFMQLYSDTAREGEGISTRMNVSGGFVVSLDFSYAAIDSAGRLQIFDGLNGTGNLLADVLLPITSPQTGPGDFVPDSVVFAGVGRSVIFTGGNKQLAFDDFLTTSAVPEPSAWSLLGLGTALSAFVGLRQRKTK